jgi:NTP pyrophosphatase (non-canonical NTP hydrolase)
MKRKQVKQKNVDDALSFILETLKNARKKHGHGRWASKHETLGILQEEVYELIKAIHENDAKDFKKELADIAITAIWGLASDD